LQLTLAPHDRHFFSALSCPRRVNELMVRAINELRERKGLKKLSS
jgi:hypothetical protein